VLELPEKLALLRVDQRPRFQGRDGVTLPAGDVRRPGELR
jgi:hypothetical protein